MEKLSRLKKFAVIALVVAFIGFLDATFLTAEHYLEGPIPCSIVKGCEIVTTSVYSVFIGLPIALYGALFYVAVIVLSILFLDRKKIMPLRLYAYLSITAFLISLGLLAVQAFILHAYCLYCLASAFFSTVLFVNGMLVLKLIRSDEMELS